MAADIANSEVADVRGDHYNPNSQGDIRPKARDEHHRIDHPPAAAMPEVDRRTTFDHRKMRRRTEGRD